MTIKAGIVGGTGYTGVELLRLLAQHPQVELKAITSRKEAGTPVAAFPAPGPRDIIPGSGAGVVSDDLREASLACLDLDRATARAYAETFSWRACAEEFVRNLTPQPKPERKRFWRRLRKLRA